MAASIKKIIKKVLCLRRHNLIAGYKISEFGHIGLHCKIGPDCLLMPRNMFLDDYVIIQARNNFVSFQGKLVIKKYSVISTSCIIIPSNHRLSVGIPFYLNAISHVGDDDHTITINEDVWIGAGCKLLPRSSFGRGCVVGAGSVVTKDIPPYAVVTGVPAKIVAFKFCKEDIMRHEKMIYSEEDRMTEKEIDELFQEYYVNMKPLELYMYSDAEKDKLQSLIESIDMNIKI